MDDGRAPHLGAKQRPEPELETDPEQKQQHADLGELGQQRRGLAARGAEGEAGEQEADERRQPDPARGEPEDEGARYPGGEHSAVSL